MERLINYIDGKYTFDGPINVKDIDSRSSVIRIMNKLGRYERMETEKRLVSLPCSINDTIYNIKQNICGTYYIEDYKVISFEINEKEKLIVTESGEKFNFHDFGSTIIIDEKEAYRKVGYLNKRKY